MKFETNPINVCHFLYQNRPKCWKNQLLISINPILHSSLLFWSQFSQRSLFAFWQNGKILQRLMFWCIILAELVLWIIGFWEILIWLSFFTSSCEPAMQELRPKLFRLPDKLVALMFLTDLSRLKLPLFIVTQNSLQITTITPQKILFFSFFCLQQLCVLIKLICQSQQIRKFFYFISTLFRVVMQATRN